MNTTANKTSKSAETQSFAGNNLPKLTRKQQAFVNELKNNPKQSATKAVMKTYNVANDKVAAVVAAENLRKPSIISHLDEYSKIVEQNITNTAIEWANSNDVKERSLSMQMNTYIHDKIHGKAVQKSVNLNATVNIEDLLNNLI